MSCIITAELLSRFEKALLREERSKATIEKYMRDVRTFLAYTGIGVEIDKEVVIEYKKHLQEHYAITSANSMLAALNHFFRCVDWPECVVRVFRTQQAVFRAGERELSHEEYCCLLETAKRRGQNWLYMVMLTLASTGIRVSELRFITIRTLSTRRVRVWNKGKERQIILPVELCRKLRAYAREKGISSGAVFVTRTGKLLDRSNIHHAMKKLCREAGVEPQKVFPHNFRHLFAVTYYARHRNIVNLAGVLGHSSINTTRIYTLMSVTETESEINCLGLVV